MNLRTRLAALETAGLIGLAQTQPEVEYLFRHALIHEAAHDSLVKPDRRTLHRAAAEVLEQLYPGRLDSRELAPLLARHFDEAGDSQRARHYYSLAGQVAAGAYANAEAAQYYAQALAAARVHGAGGPVVAELYLRRGRALELSSQDAQAVREYEEMEAWARGKNFPEHELAAVSARATVLIRPSLMQNLVEGRALAERALALARALGDRSAEARALWNLMMVYQAIWRLPPALEYGEQALAIARELGLRELTAYVLTDLQTVYFATGQSGRALEMLLVQAELTLAAGDAAHAVALMDELIAYMDRIGVRLFLVDAWHIKGRALLATGAQAEGRAALEQGRTLAEALGSRRVLWQILAELSRLAAGAGRAAEARALLAEARDVVAHIADHTNSPELRASFLGRPDVRSLLSA